MHEDQRLMNKNLDRLEYVVGIQEEINFIVCLHICSSVGPAVAYAVSRLF
jgi:hypothetical protein